MPPALLRAILFDKDGTLFNFNATWAAVYEEIILRIAPDAETARQMAEIGGFDPGRRRFRPGTPLVAGATAEVAALWAPLCPGRTAGDIEATANAIAAATVGQHRLVPAAADLPALLGALRDRGLALGVATHDSETSARAHLAAVGALDAFDFVAGYDSGHGLKPGPGMLEAFARCICVSPRQIAVVGDSLHDLGMGRTGGAAMTIGVLTGPATHDDLVGAADHVLPSIEALPALVDRVG